MSLTSKNCVQAGLHSELEPLLAKPDDKGKSKEITNSSLEIPRYTKPVLIEHSLSQDDSKTDELDIYQLTVGKADPNLILAALDRSLNSYVASQEIDNTKIQIQKERIPDDIQSMDEATYGLFLKFHSMIEGCNQYGNKQNDITNIENPSLVVPSSPSSNYEPSDIKNIGALCSAIRPTDDVQEYKTSSIRNKRSQTVSENKRKSIIQKQISRSSIASFKDLLLDTGGKDQIMDTNNNLEEKFLEKSIFEPNHSPNFDEVPVIDPDILSLAEEDTAVKCQQDSPIINEQLSGQNGADSPSVLPDQVSAKRKRHLRAFLSKRKSSINEISNEVDNVNKAGNKIHPKADYIQQAKFKMKIFHNEAPTKVEEVVDPQCCNKHVYGFCEDCSYIIGSAKSSSATESSAIEKIGCSPGIASNFSNEGIDSANSDKKIFEMLMNNPA